MSDYSKTGGKPHKQECPDQVPTSPFEGDTSKHIYNPGTASRGQDGSVSPNSHDRGKQG